MAPASSVRAPTYTSVLFHIPMGTDREGFEPSIPLRAYRFSRPAVSTAHPPVQTDRRSRRSRRNRRSRTTQLHRRTGWDSNPRNGCPLTRFPSVRLQPLGHPSELLDAEEKLIRHCAAYHGQPFRGASEEARPRTSPIVAPCTVRAVHARMPATPQQDPAAVLSRRRRPAAL